MTTEDPILTWRVRRFIHTDARLAWVVRTEREFLGLTVEDLARAAYTAPEAVQAIEDANPTVGVATVNRILDVLGVKPLVLPMSLARFPE